MQQDQVTNVKEYYVTSGEKSRTQLRNNQSPIAKWLSGERNERMDSPYLGLSHHTGGDRPSPSMPVGAQGKSSINRSEQDSNQQPSALK